MTVVPGLLNNLSRLSLIITLLAVLEVQKGAFSVVVNNDYLLDLISNHMRNNLMGIFVREFVDSV